LTRKDEEDLLRTRAFEFLETARFHMEKEYYALAIFSLEQALQLFLKSRLLSNGVDYPKIHSVVRLLEILGEITSSEKCRETISSLLDKYALELGLVEDADITSRYMVRIYKKAEAEKIFKAVEEIIKLVMENNC